MPYPNVAPNGIPDPNHPGYDTNGYPLDPNGPGGPAGPDTSRPGQGAPAPLSTDPVFGTPLPPPQKSWADLSQSTFGAMPGVTTPPPFTYDPFNAPAPFQLPSWEDVVKNDPGIDFGINRGEQALQQSAAARGTLNTGGTLQDILDYGRNAANQGYGQAYNRALGTYQTNFGDALSAWSANGANALTKYNTNFGTQYVWPYQQLMGQYDRGVSNQAQLFGQQFQTATA